MALDVVTRACAVHLRSLDFFRYLGCLFADGRDQAALVALHAFHAELARIRESVSEPMLGEIRFTWWREALEGLEQGQVREHPVIEALALPIRSARLDISALLAMIDFRQDHLYQDAPMTRQSLEVYAQQTSGALYQAAIKLTGAGDDAQSNARQLGTCASLVAVMIAAQDDAQTRSRDWQSTDIPQNLEDELFILGTQSFGGLDAQLRSSWTRRQRRALAPVLAGWITGRKAAKDGFDRVQLIQPPSAASVLTCMWKYIWIGRP